MSAFRMDSVRLVSFFAAAATVVACSATGERAPEQSSITSAERVITADNCLGGQDMDAADVDVSACPALPELPDDAPLGSAMVSLGAWEIGTTGDGDTYKYGSLGVTDGGGRVLEFDGGSAVVNDENLRCWAKGYYRLRKILQNPPSEYVALRDAGFQVRFFQFQTDLRNGNTGYKRISSYMNHLVKWVTVISVTGDCQQPTLRAFREYATRELTRRSLAIVDGGTVSLDAGTPAVDASVDAGTP